MTETDIQNKIKEKLPQVEALFANLKDGYTILKTIPGIYNISRGGQPVDLTEDQMKGLETFLNLSTIFTADDFQSKAT